MHVPTNSERLISVSDAFSAFVYGYPSSLPTCSLYPQQECAWTCIYTGHACRHLTSAVPWISKDRLLKTTVALDYWSKINKPLCMKWQKMCVGQSVAQSKNTCSWKPEFSTVEHGNQMEWATITCLAAPWDFSSQILCRLLQKSFGWGYKLRSPVCMHMQKWSHMHIKDAVVLVGVWVNYGNKQK